MYPLESSSRLDTYGKNAHMSHKLLGVSDVTRSCEPEHRTPADCYIETKAAHQIINRQTVLGDVRVILFKLDHSCVLRALPERIRFVTQATDRTDLTSEVGRSDDPIHQKKCNCKRTVTGNSSNLRAGLRDLDPGQHFGDCQKICRTKHRRMDRRTKCSIKCSIREELLQMLDQPTRSIAELDRAVAEEAAQRSDVPGA
jgi:hypothetical protein